MAQKYKKVTSRKLTLPLNRVEGDLEIRVELEDNVVTDAWSCGIMFRGFENLMMGRAPLDALVLTPRICGLCSVAHLSASSRALDDLYQAQVPDNARRIRNLAQMAENIQSDLRHGFLLFAADLASPVYARYPLHEEAVRRYEPLKGQAVLETIQETKRVLELVALLGGQWPHTAFMVPGGVASRPSSADILQCRHLLARFRAWYEKRVLGCPIPRWEEVRSAADLERWMEESEDHARSDVGFFLRYGREIGLHAMGRGHGHFLSFGGLDLPDETDVPRNGQSGKLLPAGFVRPGGREPFQQERITEHLSHSWFKGGDAPEHPAGARTVPYATGDEAERYSWIKAPRYDGLPAETGPLAEAVVGKHPLVSDLLQREGPSVLVRELARLLRPATLLPVMQVWLQELQSSDAPCYQAPAELTDDGSSRQGCGTIEAARGGLGHWIESDHERIHTYQVITPTAWNASPRGDDHVRGPWEEALVGTEIRDPQRPVEVGHVVRSYDACMVCSVHAYRKGQPVGRIRV